jgi:hypothetical protein
MTLHDVMVPKESNSARRRSSSHSSRRQRDCRKELTIEVLDVKIDTRALGFILQTFLLVALPKLLISFGTLLRTTNKELLALPLGVVELVGSLLGRFVGGEIDKAKAAISELSKH